MFAHRIRLFSLLGFGVWLDASWLAIAALVAWTLAEGVFPALVPGLDAAWYWSMAVAGAAGLGVSIIFHETAHALVARRYGIGIQGITLFVFGGVAEMEAEPESPLGEFLMALAGPVASFILAGTFFLLVQWIGQYEGLEAVAGVASYLGFLNLALGIFNLVPAFPLDGGRMLRAALSGWGHDVVWATRIAAYSGDLFGILLIVLGVLAFLRGDLIGGVWRFLIGTFLRGAAKSTYEMTVARQALSRIPVAEVMTPDPVSVPAEVSIATFIDAYVYRYRHRQFPVLRDGVLAGRIGTRQATAIARRRWDAVTVAEALEPCSSDDVIAPEVPAHEALAKMTKTGRSPLFVIGAGRLVGILSMRDLMELLSVTLELPRHGGADGTVRGGTIRKYVSLWKGRA